MAQSNEEQEEPLTDMEKIEAYANDAREIESISKAYGHLSDKDMAIYYNGFSDDFRVELNDWYNDPVTCVWSRE